MGHLADHCALLGEQDDLVETMVQSITRKAGTEALLRVAIAFACGIPSLVTLTLAATSEMGSRTTPIVWVLIALLALSPFVLYVRRIRGLRRSLVSGAIVGVITIWWVVGTGPALRSIDDGLELGYPVLAALVQCLVVAGALEGQKNLPAPPRPDNERPSEQARRKVVGAMRRPEMWTKVIHLEDPRPPDLVLAELREALDRIGKVKESDDPEWLIGSTRYGLQRVSIKVHIRKAGEGSELDLEAFADDIWGVGARKGLKKLLKAAGRDA
jgi:hypothetical protein